MLKKYQLKNIYMGRLPHDADLIKELTKIIKEKEIEAGKITVIGAVKQGRISFYDQDKQQYLEKTVGGEATELEIVNCTGNISLKDGEPIVHAHISFGDEQGKIFGGHLAEGTIIFAGEYVIEEFAGEPLKRGKDEVTGLPLWTE